MNERSRIFYGWWVVLGGALLLAVIGPAAVTLANVYQTAVAAELGVSEAAFTISNSIILGVGIFLPPFITKMYSQGNFKRFFIISVIIYAAAYASLGLVNNIWTFYLLAVFVGYGYAATSLIPVSMLINNWFANKQGLAMSIAMAGLGVGGSLFSAPLNYMMANFGWRVSYMVSGLIIALISIPVMLFIIKVKPSDIGEVVDGVPRDSGALTEIEKDNRTDQTNVQSPFSVIKSQPFFYALIIGGVLVGLANNGGLGQFPPYMQNLHGYQRAATITSIYAGVGIGGKILLGLISDKFGPSAATGFGSFILTFAFITAMFAQNYSLALLMALLFGTANSVGTVLGPLVVTNMVSKDNFGVVYGYFQSSFQLGMTFASVLVATIAQLTGSYNLGWLLMAVAAATAGILWIWSQSKAKSFALAENKLSNKNLI